MFADGSVYDGMWRDNKRSGNGEMTWIKDHNSEFNYAGDWADDKKTGFGTYRWPDGTKYEGGFSNDQMTGGVSSRLEYYDRSVYVGDFKDNKRHG